MALLTKFFFKCKNLHNNITSECFVVHVFSSQAIWHQKSHTRLIIVCCWSTYNCHNIALPTSTCTALHWKGKTEQNNVYTQKKSRLCANGLPVRTIQKPFFTPHKNEHQSSLYTHILEFTNNCRNEQIYNTNKKKTHEQFWECEHRYQIDNLLL